MTFYYLCVDSEGSKYLKAVFHSGKNIKAVFHSGKNIKAVFHSLVHSRENIAIFYG